MYIGQIPPDNRSSELSGTSTRSKAELWEEVKMLSAYILLYLN